MPDPNGPIDKPEPHLDPTAENARPKALIPARTVAITTGSVRPTLFVLAMPVLGEQLLNSFVAIFDVFLAGSARRPPEP